MIGKNNMRYQITKIAHGLYRLDVGDGYYSDHSTKQGAIEMLELHKKTLAYQVWQIEILKEQLFSEITRCAKKDISRVMTFFTKFKSKK